MKNFIKEIFGKIKRTLYPRFGCYTCGREVEDLDSHLCENCKPNLKRISGNVCSRCGKPIPSPNVYCDNCKSGDYFKFYMARACFEYEGLIRKPIQDLKYNGKKYVAEFFAKYLLDTMKEAGITPDIIVPAPISPKRLKTRGFNQSELLAEELSKLCGVPVASNLVRRIKEVDPQANLKRNERLANLKGVFKAEKSKAIEGKTILIIDDVFTTGTTANEIAKALEKSKPSRIYVLTVAKTC